ncbi:hypothetical protein ID866_9579 [Astraeus odoratus]|nr:hypothetical protein ID866_9579 [Astraeus odoratus]
MQVLWRIEALM